MSRDYSLLWVVGIMGAIGVGAIAALALLGPHFDATLPFPESTLQWKQYRNPRVGYHLLVPAQFEVDPDDDGDSVLFRFHGTPLIHVAWLDEQSARQRGLWPRAPAGADIELAGVPGRRYHYSHFDAVFGVRVVADVIAYRGRFLALEFRTRRSSVLEKFGWPPQASDPPAGYIRKVRESFQLEISPGGGPRDRSSGAPFR